VVEDGRPEIQMKIAMVYVYAGTMGQKYDDYAQRFVQCYHDFPPGIEHDSIVMLNGVRETSEIACMFSPLPNLSLIMHDNSGFDIGAFQHAAKVVPCDMILFFGASTFMRRAGWLLRMVEAYQKHGPGQYGRWGAGLNCGPKSGRISEPRLSGCRRG